jgi:hypothetical protein
VLLLCVVLVGFGRSFHLRGLLGPKPLNVLHQWHGTGLTLWSGLTVIQGLLIRAGNKAWHSRLAWLVVAAVTGVVFSGAWVNTAWAMQLASHRRLILFASIAIIGPAFARVAFWPWVGLGVAAAPAFAGVGMLILIVMAVGDDFATLRRLHRATLGGLTGIFLPLIVGMGVAVSGLGFALTHRGGCPELEVRCCILSRNARSRRCSARRATAPAPRCA